MGGILFSNKSLLLEMSKLGISPLARFWHILFKGNWKPFKKKYQRKLFFHKTKMHFLTDAEVTQILHPNASGHLGELTNISKSSRPGLSFPVSLQLPLFLSGNGKTGQGKYLLVRVFDADAFKELFCIPHPECICQLKWQGSWW